jgi:hypothetical protein
VPGAWELTHQTSVLVAILHTDNTTVAWSFGLRNLILPAGNVVGLAGMPYDMARNVACKEVVDKGYEWLFFLDSDVVPPRDTLIRLINHRRPVISGVYCRRSPPASIPVAIKGGQWVNTPPNSGVIEVDLVGAGCLLIHRSVLEQLPPLDERRGKKWFDWRVDMAHSLPPGEALSEDFAFCLQCKKHGIPILLDTNIQCKHVGYAQSTYGQLVPLETNSMT